MLFSSARTNLATFLVFLTPEITATVAWYTSAAVVANSERAKPILPVGNPLWS